MFLLDKKIETYLNQSIAKSLHNFKISLMSLDIDYSLAWYDQEDAVINLFIIIKELKKSPLKIEIYNQICNRHLKEYSEDVFNTNKDMILSAFNAYERQIKITA